MTQTPVMAIAQHVAPHASWPLGAAVLALHGLLIWALWQAQPRWAPAVDPGRPRPLRMVMVPEKEKAAVAPATTPRPAAAVRATPRVTPRVTTPPEAIPPQARVPANEDSRWSPPPPTAVADAVPAHDPLAEAAPPPVRHATAPPLTSARADHRRCPQVPHPQALRERGVEGSVHLLVRVGADGTPAEVRIAAGSGWRLLDEAALVKAHGCRFVPARRGDEAVESWVDFAVRFALR